MIKEIIKKLKNVFWDYRFLRSLFCGFATLLFDLILIKILQNVFWLTQEGVVVIAFLCAIVFNFILQKKLVFKYHGPNKRKNVFSLFFLFWIIGSIFNLVLVKLFLFLLNNIYLAQICASFVLALLSFYVYKKFIFNTENIDTSYFFRVSHIIKTCTLLFFWVFLFRCILLLFLYATVGDGAIVWGDSTRYIGNALSFIEYNTFSFKGFLEVYRTPGYPLFLVIFLFFNVPVYLIALFSVFLSSFIPVFTYLLSLKIGLRNRWAILAAVFIGFEPMMVYYGIPVLPDTIFTLFLLLIGFLFYHYVLDNKLYILCTIGILLGVLNYIRQVGVYLVFLMVIYAFLNSYLNKGNIKKSLAHCMLLLFIVMMFALPWYYRNFKHFGVWDFSSALPVNFFNYVGVGTLATSESSEYEPVRIKMMEQFTKSAPVPNDQKDLRNKDYLINVTLEIIKSHPVSYIKTVILGLNTLYFSGNYHYLLLKFGFIDPPPAQVSYSLVLAHSGISGLFKTVSHNISLYLIIAILGKLFWIVIVLSSVIGGVLLYKRQESHIFFMFFFYFSLTILSVGIGVEARHRYPINPLIIAFAFVTISRVYEKTFNRNTSIQ